MAIATDEVENDYQKELWNGSLGRIETIQSSNGKRALLCSLDGTPHEIPEEDFHRIDLAYAITIHKAQGSQFARVIVSVRRSRLLHRTLIYTALTMRDCQTVFIGHRDAFKAGRRRAATLTRAAGRVLGVNLA